MTINAIGSNNPVQVAFGGTGQNEFTAYAPLCAGATPTDALIQASSGIANTGYVLTSTGASSVPTWQASPGSGTSGIFGVNLEFGGSSTGNVYSRNVGQYFSIGNVVYITINLSLTALGSAFGVATLTGLPTPSGSTLANNIFYMVSTSTSFSAGYNYPWGNVSASSSTISLMQTGPGLSPANFTNSNFNNTSTISMQGFYFTS